MLVNSIVIAIGLLISLLLFYRFPILKKSTKSNRLYQVSIIIPARNEEANIALLLKDLKKQKYPIHEIICVDDCSLDDTAEVVLTFGAKLIRVTDKPDNWMGKSWACQKGSEAASGEILVFLDADVRLTPEGISSLLGAYDENQCVISIQPYHQTKKSYEEFSLFFNLIQIAANGMTMILTSQNTGLYGPVILIHKATYNAIDGHKSAKNSIVDDIALGNELMKKGYPFKLFLGGEFISYRMYSGGFYELLHGWTKNYATGALKTPMILFVMVFLWVTSCTSVVLNLFLSIIIKSMHGLILYFLFYILWIVELYRISHKIGNFKKKTIISYPISLFMFLWVFVLSLLKKMFHMNVVWKDRKIKLEK